MNKKRKIILVSGDPNSINSEIIWKSWKKLNNSIKKKIYVIANKELLEKQFKKINCKIKIKDVKNIKEKSKSNELKIINVDLKFKDPFNVNKRNASTYIKKCLGIGHKLALEKNIFTNKFSSSLLSMDPFRNQRSKHRGQVALGCTVFSMGTKHRRHRIAWGQRWSL